MLYTTAINQGIYFVLFLFACLYYCIIEVLFYKRVLFFLFLYFF